MSPMLTVYIKACRESLRDRRVLINSLLLGPLIGPLLFLLLMRLVVGRELEKAEPPIAVVVIEGSLVSFGWREAQVASSAYGRVKGRIAS